MKNDRLTENEARLLAKGSLIYVLTTSGWKKGYFVKTGVNLGGKGIYADVPGKGKELFFWLHSVKLPDVNEIGIFKTK